MLRKLGPKDAERMLEWMHNEEVIQGLQADVFRTKTIDDCFCFIKTSQCDDENYHRAIVDEWDTYQGTVSLKNIDKDFLDAEFAIVLHPEAQGKGLAKQGMHEILDIAFNELGLNEVYWNVLKTNVRAIALYEKMGAILLGNPSERIMSSAPQGRDVVFYKMVKTNEE